MDAVTRDAVQRRTDGRCEYCVLRQEHSELTHHAEHIIAKQHGGSEELDNLALACHLCNLRKGPNLTGIDPVTGRLVPLFHPRRNRWADHFRFRSVPIEGITPVGRATVQVLGMNDARRLELRSQLLTNAVL